MTKTVPEYVDLTPEEITTAGLIPTGTLVWWSTGMVGIYKARVTGYYRRTVNVFLIGVTLAVAGAAIDMYSNFQSS